jgi:hypothetical protein
MELSPDADEWILESSDMQDQVELEYPFAHLEILDDVVEEVVSGDFPERFVISK